ncbi:MAG: hypothetical protein HC828_14085 [Blastochloris sp.]|nr:hypothetical protein [Blastochloris sp.]
MRDAQNSAYLLAADGRGWHIRMSADGTIQLDVGLACLLLTHTELLEIHRLAEMALNASDDQEIPAWSSPLRAVWRYPQTDALALIFDRAILRFHQHEFPRFVRLCRQAAAALGPPAPCHVATPGRSLRDRVN